MQDGKPVPHDVRFQVGDILSDTYTCETGMSGVKLKFPKGKYKTRVILDVVVYVIVGEEYKRFDASITLGR